MKRITLYSFILGSSMLLACQGGKKNFDASGAFEADETIISAEAAGVLKAFSLEEGQQVEAGTMLGYVDSTQLYLRKKQLETQIRAILAQTPDINRQVAALQSQLRTAERESLRVANLLKAEAATQKQMDDIHAQAELLRKQLEAQQSTLGVNTESIRQQTAPLQVQIEQLNDQLTKCRIINPVKGMVLTRYTHAYEIVNPGKALYKIADLSELILRVYVSGDQLPGLKLNQTVKVFADAGAGEMKEYPGRIQWISDKAEFTPKTIQTKNERANQVYAVKLRVKNDGFLKIGMYGEIQF